MAICYRNGTIVSVPLKNFRPSIDRSASPSQKCFGVSFKSKMKIYDAAHVQSMEITTSGLPNKKNNGLNHCFLTPTFDLNDIDSYKEKAANDAIKRFTDNIKKTYGCTSYVWVKEFTKELTPHFHMLVTIPYTSISKLNKAWSHARGDINTVKNALRTGWNPRTKKPVMKIQSFKQAVGYAAKYIGKSLTAGDISVLRMSNKISDRKVWEYKTGHSSKCYGLSQNLLRPAKQIDFNVWQHMNPRFRTYGGNVIEEKEKVVINLAGKLIKSEFAEIFYCENPIDSKRVYREAEKTFQRNIEVIKNVSQIKENSSEQLQMFRDYGVF